MDALEQFLGGGQATAPGQPPKSASVITDQILDRLKMVESSDDPYALNKESKAMGAYQFMPEQVQTMHKQGIEFNPFNEKESRIAAKSYLEKLVKEKGSVEKALAAYGGFVTKDPTDYVKKVMQGQPSAPAAQPTQSSAAPTTADPLEAFFSNKPVSPAPQAAPADMGTRGTAAGTMGAYVPSYQPQAPEQAPQAGEPGVVGGLINKYFQTREGMKGAAAGIVNAIANVPTSLAQSATRLGAEAIGQKEAGQKLAAQIPNVPIGKITGQEGKPAYEKSLPVVLGQLINTYGIEPVAKQLNMEPQKLGDIVNLASAATPFIKKPIAIVKNAIAETGELSRNAAPIEGAMPAPAAPGVGTQAQYEIPAYLRKGEMTPAQVTAKQTTFEAEKAGIQPPTKAELVAPKAAAGALTASAGAMATPDATTIKQALSAATPELQNALKNIPVEETHLPTFQRHIEADSLPVPIRLTEGQATGDVVKLSNEMNRRGKDPEIAQRLNSQNGQLLENINAIRDNAAPNAYGTKKIENSQAIIDAYKSIDDGKTSSISAAYKALEDANGGQFPVDGVQLANNATAMLGKKLKTEFLPSSIKSQLDRFKSGEPMTFEQFEAMRTNLAAEIRKAERTGDGNAAAASGIVRQALEDLPLQGNAAKSLKPLADTARSLAKDRFDMLKKDPAYKAAVDDTVPADKFIDKFVVNGVNKNIQTMVDHLGRDSVAHQHMAAGTVNWLKDKAGIVDETGNFSQAQYNKALKQLDDVNNLREIFNPEAASQLKTLGNVARYTQAQPRGAFVNNSNTLVGALAEKARAGVGFAAEKGLNMAVPGFQLGTSVMEMRARRAAAEETRKALELGAGTKQTGSNKIQNLGQ
jgi:hypothetical protein